MRPLSMFASGDCKLNNVHDMTSTSSTTHLSTPLRGASSTNSWIAPADTGTSNSPIPSPFISYTPPRIASTSSTTTPVSTASTSTPAPLLKDATLPMVIGVGGDGLHPVQGASGNQQPQVIEKELRSRKQTVKYTYK